MGLSQRDKALIADINRFRVMDRDSIAELHFGHLKRPVNSANSVLKRLVNEGHIRRSTKFGVPYLYLSKETSLKENSAKIGHFLAIVQVYRDILKNGSVLSFLVEPKYGKKGAVEPDAFCLFESEYGKTPFFIEVQKTIYSEKTMQEKLKRYVTLYESGIIRNEPWQTENPVFPHVLILSDTRYALDGDYPFRVFQAPSFSQFIRTIKRNEQYKEPIHQTPQKPTQHNSLPTKPKINFQPYQQTQQLSNGIVFAGPKIKISKTN
jgi:hypothetical protein